MPKQESFFAKIKTLSNYDRKQEFCLFYVFMPYQYKATCTWGKPIG